MQFSMFNYEKKVGNYFNEFYQTQNTNMLN